MTRYSEEEKQDIWNRMTALCRLTAMSAVVSLRASHPKWTGSVRAIPNHRYERIDVIPFPWGSFTIIGDISHRTLEFMVANKYVLAKAPNFPGCMQVDIPHDFPELIPTFQGLLAREGISYDSGTFKIKIRIPAIVEYEEEVEGDSRAEAVETLRARLLAMEANDLTGYDIRSLSPDQMEVEEVLRV